MHRFSIQSKRNDRLYFQYKIKDVLAEQEEWHIVNAIIDTGATASAISVDLAEKLNLISAGEMAVESAAYKGYTDFYFLDISIEEFYVEKLCVSAFPHNVVDFIIGMDILGQGRFSFKKEGEDYYFIYRISHKQFLDLKLKNQSIFRYRIDKLLNYANSESDNLNEM